MIPGLEALTKGLKGVAFSRFLQTGSKVSSHGCFWGFKLAGFGDEFRHLDCDLHLRADAMNIVAWRLIRFSGANIAVPGYVVKPQTHQTMNLHRLMPP